MFDDKEKEIIINGFLKESNFFDYKLKMVLLKRTDKLNSLEWNLIAKISNKILDDGDKDFKSAIQKRISLYDDVRQNMIVPDGIDVPFANEIFRKKLIEYSEKEGLIVKKEKNGFIYLFKNFFSTWNIF